MAGSAATAQWAVRLFKDLPEDALLEGLRVVALCQDRSQSPCGYIDIWRAPPDGSPPPLPPPIDDDDQDGLPLDDNAGLLFCVDVCLDEQFEQMRHLVRDLCCRMEPPQLLLLLARSPPPLSKPEVSKMYKDRLKLLLEDGFDDVVPFHPSSFNLAFQVHAKVSATRQRLDAGLHAYQWRRLHAHRHAKAKHIVDYAMWHYLPAKVTRMIPRVTNNLHSQPLQGAVAGNTFVKRLGAGFYGQVYASVTTPVWEQAAHEGTTVVPSDAIKVVSKSGLFGLREIKMLHHMIMAHNLLSSPRMQHPNIAMLRAIYHSPTHLFFRMEYAGPESLYARLTASTLSTSAQIKELLKGPVPSKNGGGKDRQQRSMPPGTRLIRHRPVTTVALRAILDQVANAVAHLHLNAGCCHRDLKLENFVVATGTTGPADVPRIKLVDFDFARVVNEPMEQGGGAAAAMGGLEAGRNRCHGKCGTVPYVAPEVVFERSYDGMMADVWSLGVLFLEVFCGVRVMESTFDIEHKAEDSGGESVAQVAERTREDFGKPGFVAQLLRAKAREEALPMMEGEEAGRAADALLTGMLAVSPDKRLDMAQVQNILAGLPPPVPSVEDGALAIEEA